MTPRLIEVFVFETIHTPRFKVGQRVNLKAYPVGHPDFPDGLPAEKGVVRMIEPFKQVTQEQFYIIDLFTGDQVEVPDEQIEDPKGMN